MSEKEIGYKVYWGKDHSKIGTPFIVIANTEHHGTEYFILRTKADDVISSSIHKSLRNVNGVDNDNITEQFIIDLASAKIRDIVGSELYNPTGSFKEDDNKPIYNLLRFGFLHKNPEKIFHALYLSQNDDLHKDAKIARDYCDSINFEEQ